MTAPSHPSKYALQGDAWYAEHITQTASMGYAIGYLRSLDSIRRQCNRVLAKAEANALHHFTLDAQRMDDVAAKVVALMRRDYRADEGFPDLPPHSRWRHLEAGCSEAVRAAGGRVGAMVTQHVAPALPSTLSPHARRLACTRAVLDLFIVAVLLDAGAGAAWHYIEPGTGKTFRRSEGLAVATYHMFLDGVFSSDPGHPCQADAEGLFRLSLDTLRKGFQADRPGNDLVGLEGRHQLLRRLGAKVMLDERHFPRAAGARVARPGHLLDGVLARTTTTATPGGDDGADDGAARIVVPMEGLWASVVHGFDGVWPATRTHLGATSMGDVWPCPALQTAGRDAADDARPGTRDAALRDLEALARAPAGALGPLPPAYDHLVPFHKLSQWLTYSLMEPMTAYMDVQFTGVEAMTGLAEYRNGGLFVDMGVLRLKEADRVRGLAAASALGGHGTDEGSMKGGGAAVEVVPMFTPEDPVMVEWRALTVALLDQVADKVRATFGMPDMALAKVLEGGTWKAGREVAAEKRPNTKGPPIGLISDGTVF